MRHDGIGLALAVLLLFLAPHCKHFETKSDPKREPIIEDGRDTRDRLAVIGRELLALKAENRLRRYEGAAFLLQVKDRLADDDLGVFISPTDQSPPGPRRPKIGSRAFIRMYRNLELPDGVEPRHCSFAGPNWTDYPEDQAAGRRIWACDACWGDRAPGNRVHVLWDDGTVEVLRLSSIEGAEPQTGTVHVGPHSPDPRLRTMCFEKLR